MLRLASILLLLACIPTAAATLGDTVEDARTLVYECVWYLPSLVGAGYCYDYETSELCINEPTGTEPCAKLSGIPFLDEDQMMYFVHCARQIEPEICLDGLETR